MTSATIVNSPSYVSSWYNPSPYATAYYAPSFYNRLAYTYPVGTYGFRWAKKMAKKAA